MKNMQSMVRKQVFALLAAVALLGAGVVQAQEAGAAGARVGFVNTDRLFSEANAAQAAQNRLKQEFSGREKSLMELGSRVQHAVEQFQKDAPKMTEAQRLERQNQLMVQDADFQQRRREFQEDLNNRKNEELQKLLDKANRVVIQIAKAENIDVVLQEAVYVNRRLDITDKVIAALNADK